MTKLKFLSTGLIAVAMLTTAAVARESHVNVRYIARGVDAASTAPDIDGRLCIPAPRVGAFASQPWTNSNTPCEPAQGH